MHVSAAISSDLVSAAPASFCSQNRNPPRRNCQFLTAKERENAIRDLHTTLQKQLPGDSGGREGF